MRLMDKDAFLEKMKRTNRYFDVKFDIEEMPTIDAVPVVHGRWVNVQNGKGCCSECNRLDAIDPIATHCRYCGADMRERKDGES